MSLDSMEYKLRKQKPFSPPEINIKDVHDAVPKYLFERSVSRCLYYVAKDFALIGAFCYLGTKIDTATDILTSVSSLGSAATVLVGWGLWISYWIWQGFAMSGLWILGHDLGHDSLSPSEAVNMIVGLVVHSVLLTPYPFWRSIHRSHHKGTNNIDRDPTFRPPTREALKLPAEEHATPMDYHNLLEDTPIYSLYALLVHQFIGFPIKMITLRRANGKFPPGVKHRPGAHLWQPVNTANLVLSDVGVGLTAAMLVWWMRETSFLNVVRLYFVPWALANHWLVTITFLQHTDPTIPHYRGQWSFLRGALATVDRPMLGWVGRAVLHNICHDHIAHHFFSHIPFYNLPEVTEAIRPVLGDAYCYDSSPILYALWRSWTQCKFIESEGNIVFYKDQQGKPLRESVIHKAEKEILLDRHEQRSQAVSSH